VPKYEFISFRWFSEVLGGPARYVYFPELAITYGGPPCTARTLFGTGDYLW